MEIMKKSANHLLVSKGWIQAVAIVVVFGFFVLGLLAYRTYKDEPPIPAKTVGAAGEVLFTHQDVVDGQGVFLRNGLMEYGSNLPTRSLSWSGFHRRLSSPCSPGCNR